MSLRIPRPRFRLGWLCIVVALAALMLFAMMPVRPGIVDRKVGTGPAIEAGDTVEVHYVGRLGGTRLSDWLGAGKEFDSSQGPECPRHVPSRRGPTDPGLGHRHDGDEGRRGAQAGDPVEPRPTGAGACRR